MPRAGTGGRMAYSTGKPELGPDRHQILIALRGRPVTGHASVVRGLQAPPSDVETAPSVPAQGVSHICVVRHRKLLAARLRDVPAELEARAPGERDELRGVVERVEGADLVYQNR